MAFSYGTGQARGCANLKINLTEVFPPSQNERLRTMPLQVAPLLVHNPHGSPHDFTMLVTIPFHDYVCGTWRLDKRLAIHFRVPVDEIATKLKRGNDFLDNLYIRFRCHKFLNNIHINMRCWFNDPITDAGSFDPSHLHLSHSHGDWECTKLPPHPPDPPRPGLHH